MSECATVSRSARSNCARTTCSHGRVSQWQTETTRRSRGAETALGHAAAAAGRQTDRRGGSLVPVVAVTDWPLLLVEQSSSSRWIRSDAQRYGRSRVGVGVGVDSDSDRDRGGGERRGAVTAIFTCSQTVRRLVPRASKGRKGDDDKQIAAFEWNA